jgi:hypothetical protein
LSGRFSPMTIPRFAISGRDGAALIQIRMCFWKIVTAPTAKGLAVFGVVLEQHLSVVRQQEFIILDAFSRFLQPLADIQKMAGIVFTKEALAVDQLDLRGPEMARSAKVAIRRRS